MAKLNALVKKAKKGDNEAFIQLIKQYEQVLYKVANKLLNNDEDVADAMQDAILSAYEKLDSLKNPAYFNTWICKILINKCNSILNKNKNIFEAVDVEELQQQTNDSISKMELEDELNALNTDYKTAIVLYYIVGMNTKEISEFLKEPEGTIKSRLSRAKSILRSNYDKGGGVIGYVQ
ncbi:sigma-70 family RNA polymerase sigma factor [Neobacillus novalis]|uniref:Sigma-70 family RNA polymerase sigma factor n=1 Tax=Neobacillus novalis TaxID=220687 RepID=A0AA95MQF3_9BACI|nr:sigma-70 family RNA polymerase sigma factor [Neobacillus novalis]WHY86514.1 sigma-70 family RNA polymerase sigma factor [Neobacillus novalis]